jgi:hypothetical protein
MMQGSYTFPLAQVADLLPDWMWLIIYAVGFGAPLVALLISFGLKTASARKRVAVGIYYAVALSLYAAMVALVPNENPIVACTFLLLIPVGVFLGLSVLADRGHVAEPRGFEVKLAPNDKEG